MLFHGDPNKSYTENLQNFFDEFENEINRMEAEVRLSNIFFTVDFAIKDNQKEDLLSILQILLNTLPTYRPMMKSDSVYLQFFQHVGDVKSAVELEDKLTRQRVWQRIDGWLQSGKPSFILDFSGLRKLANID